MFYRGFELSRLLQHSMLSKASISTSAFRFLVYVGHLDRVVSVTWYPPSHNGRHSWEKCCVWELPPEKFELDMHTYKGLPLIRVINDITQVEDRHLVPTDVTTNPRVSYSVHTAHKLAEWILHIRFEEFVTSLENRAISESVHAAFLNLTEFKGVLMETLLPCLVFYLLIYDRDFLVNSITYFDEIYINKKTAYDVLLDTILTCGKARELYVSAGLSASCQDKDLRSALYLALTRCIDESPIDGARSVSHPGQRGACVPKNGKTSDEDIRGIHAPSRPSIIRRL